MTSSELLIQIFKRYEPNDPEPIRSFNRNLPPTLTISTPCKRECCSILFCASDWIARGIIVENVVVPAEEACFPDGQFAQFFFLI